MKETPYSQTLVTLDRICVAADLHRGQCFAFQQTVGFAKMFLGFKTYVKIDDVSAVSIADGKFIKLDPTAEVVLIRYEAVEKYHR